MPPLKTISVPTDTNLVIKQKSYSHPFSKIGRLNTKHNQGNTMDLLDILFLLSKPSYRTFLALKDKMEFKTNRAEKQIAGMSKAQKDTYRVQLNELVKRNLIKIGRNGKMIKQRDGSVSVLPKDQILINPYLIIPPVDVQESIMDFWDKY